MLLALRHALSRAAPRASAPAAPAANTLIRVSRYAPVVAIGRPDLSRYPAPVPPPPVSIVSPAAPRAGGRSATVSVLAKVADPTLPIVSRYPSGGTVRDAKIALSRYAAPAPLIKLRAGPLLGMPVVARPVAPAPLRVWAPGPPNQGPIGDQPTNGALAVTLGDATCVATLDVVGPVTGTLAATLADATVASTATVAVVGSAAVTLADATLSATASVAVTGTLGATLGAATLSSAASVGVTGTAAITLGAASLTSTATVDVAAAIGATLGAATLSAAATVAVSAASAVTLGSATLDATATVPVVAAASIALADATLSAAGTVSGGAPAGVTASLTVTLEPAFAVSDPAQARLAFVGGDAVAVAVRGEVDTMTLRIYDKDPSDVCTYTIDWSSILSGDTITGTPTWAASPSGLTVAHSAVTATTSTVLASSGTAGVQYLVSCLIATAAGRTYQRSITLRVSEL